ncbi:MAG: hypothetical protein ACPGPS_20185, partial [Rubripirellula sp.]
FLSINQPRHSPNVQDPTQIPTRIAISGTYAQRVCPAFMFRFCAADALIFWLTLDFAKCKCVRDHFNFDISSGWYAHGDRIKAASSAGSR